MKKNNIILVIILVLLFAVALTLVYLEKRDGKDALVTENKKVSVLKNYNEFYTVNSCVYRYLTYVQSRNSDSLLKVLDDSFVKNNNINSTNVLNFINVYEENINFNSRKMFYEKVNSHITKYYVYGYVEKDIIDDDPLRYEAYYIVNLDSKNKVFSIMPYSGELFK